MCDSQYPRLQLANMIIYCSIDIMYTLQVKTLGGACQLLPCSNWWIKADGADVINSLEESVKLEWNGDVDHGDGAWQKLHEEYCCRLKVINKLDGRV